MQAHKSRMEKEKMVEAEPQLAYEIPTETQSSALVVRPKMGEERPTALRIDRGGPSRPRMELRRAV